MKDYYTPERGTKDHPEILVLELDETLSVPVQEAVM